LKCRYLNFSRRIQRIWNIKWFVNAAVTVAITVVAEGLKEYFEAVLENIQ
jgi:hypothetical protein